MSSLNIFYLDIERFNYQYQKFIKPLLNERGYLNPYKPRVYFRSKPLVRELITEGIFIEVFKRLYDLRLSVLYIPYNNPFYNTLLGNPSWFSPEEYKEITKIIGTISEQILNPLINEIRTKRKTTYV